MVRRQSGALLGALLLAGIQGPAHAANSTTYALTLSSDDLTHISGTGWVTGNIPNGNTYATVTIDDMGAPGLINFTVALGSYWSGKGAAGIDSFGFNVLEPEETVGLVTTDVISLPATWLADVDYTPPNSGGTAQNGFGKFDAAVDSNSVANRQDPLTFSIDNQFNAFDTIADYIAGSNPGSNGSSLFAVHIAGFDDQNPDNPVGSCIGQTPDSNVQDCNYLTSVWVGGGTAVVPVPAAVWLFGSGLLSLVGVARRKRS